MVQFARQGRSNSSCSGYLEVSTLNHKSNSKDFQQKPELASHQRARKISFQAKHRYIQLESQDCGGGVSSNKKLALS